MASAMMLMLPCPSPRLGTSQFADHPEEPQCLLRVIGLARSDYQGDNHAPLDPDAGGQRSGHPENPLFRQVGAKSTNLTSARTGAHQLELRFPVLELSSGHNVGKERADAPPSPLRISPGAKILASEALSDWPPAERKGRRLTFRNVYPIPTSRRPLRRGEGIENSS